MSAWIKRQVSSMGLRLNRVPTLQRVYFEIMRRIAPAPYQRDNMEVLIGPWKGASAARCREQRQFGENNTYPDHYVEKRYETRPYNFEGSRRGCPVNTSALKSVLRNWPDGIEIIDFVRSAYITRYAPGAQTLSYVDLYFVSEICMAIPAYLLRRRDHPVRNGEIPAPVGAVYKLVAGLSKIVVHMAARGEPWMPDGQAPTAAQLYEYADKERLLLAHDGEACGGPKPKIVELIDITINGMPRRDTGKRQQEFFALLGDPGGLIEYGVRCASLKLGFMLLKAEVAGAVVRLRNARLQPTGRALAEKLSEWLRADRQGSLDDRRMIDRRIEILTCFLLKARGPQLCSLIDDESFAGAAAAAIEPSDTLARLRGAGCGHAVIFIERYGRILACASAFANSEQRRLDQILGREAAAPPNLETIANRVSEGPLEALRSVLGVWVPTKPVLTEAAVCALFEARA